MANYTRPLSACALVGTITLAPLAEAAPAAKDSNAPKAQPEDKAKTAAPSPEPAEKPAEPAASPQPAATTTAEVKATPSATSTRTDAAASPAGGAASPAESSPSATPASSEGTRYSPRDPEPDRKRWIHRYPPQAMTGEVGVFGGVWFPNKRLELYGPDPDLPDEGLQRLSLAAPEIGLRGGFYPLRFLGVEAEAAVMPTRTQETEGRATAWTVRGHVIAQLGLWSITPFLLVGVGVIGIAGEDPPESLGSDQDVAIHFGGGAKFQINDRIQLRLDVRDVVSNRAGVGEGLASSPEVLAGLTVTLGRRKKGTASPRQADRDGDGVRDEDDFCPDVFGEAPRGCPQVCVDDKDADGMSDPVDACPADPESRNGFEDDDGCPDEVPEEIESLAGVMEGIEFDTDKDTIRPESQATLERAVEVMKKYPDLRVEIGGHTDSRGGYRHNVDLSQRRAASVKAFMVDAGVDATRMETQGFGPDQPIASNETPDGRARNRRIEFKVLTEEP